MSVVAFCTGVRDAKVSVEVCRLLNKLLLRRLSRIEDVLLNDPLRGFLFHCLESGSENLINRSILIITNLSIEYDVDCSGFFRSMSWDCSPRTREYIAAYISRNLRSIPIDDYLITCLRGIVSSDESSLHAVADILVAISGVLSRDTGFLSNALLDHAWMNYWLVLMYESRNIALKMCAFRVTGRLMRYCGPDHVDMFLRPPMLLRILKCTDEGMSRVHIAILGFLYEMIDYHGGPLDFLFEDSFRDVLLDFVGDNHPFKIRSPALKVLCQCFLKASHSQVRQISPILTVDFFLEMMPGFYEKHQALILQCLGRILQTYDSNRDEYDFRDIFLAFNADEVLGSVIDHGSPALSSLAALLMNKLGARSTPHG
jgi:hypothetical protein